MALAIALLACSPREPEPAAPPTLAPATVTLAEFQALNWIVGTWRGSGGAYAAFFEEYQMLEDSTMLMRSFADSTLSVVTDSSRIAWRNGTIQSGEGAGASVAVEVTPTSIRFGRPGTAMGGHTFTRSSADEWTATLHPASPGGQATVYTMRRLPR